MCLVTGFIQASKGQNVFFSDDIPRIYLMKKGALKLVGSNEEGKEVIHDLIREGDVFGQLPAPDGSSESEYAVVLTDESIICSFLASDFEALMLRKPHLAIRFSRIMAFRYKRISNSYSNLFFKPAKTRLILFLYEWALREGKANGDELVIDNYLTQNDLSQVICTTRQTGTALLTELHQQGILSYSRKQIVVHNPELLKKLAKM